MQKRRRSFGIRGWLIAAAIFLVVLLLSARGLARVYTDYLWFQEVHFGKTWRGLIEAKAFPALIFSVIFFVAMYVDLVVADRLAPMARSAGPEDEIVERYRSVVEPYAGRIRFAVAAFFAVVMASGVASEWRDWILFSHASKFGIKDPQFHKDIGFYVFRLPFLEFIAGWTFAALLVILIVTLVFHYLNGGIRLQSPFQRVTPQVKVHISVILALMALTKTVQYYLSRFGLTLSHRGVVDGATYTDVKAQLPALNLLMLISVAAAILFIANIFRKGWVFPIIAVGLWGFISIVVGTIYPAVIQRFVVQPNEFAREQTYISRNIRATRDAFNLGSDKITTKPFEYNTDITAQTVAKSDNAQTIHNARLWDPTPLGNVLGATEEFQPFYSFSDVDVDRYNVGGQETQALSGVRELDASQLPSNTWTNRHLVYTHGYGIDTAQGNDVNGDQPSYLLHDIPAVGALPLTQPDVYFGEGLTSYSVVDSKVAEQEANGESAGQNKTTQYHGDGGVKVKNIVRRLAFALRFGDFNLVYSGQVTTKSRILYLRDIQDRVRTAAPFLQWDADPYAVNLDGKIVWVLDGYTTSNRYPYSQSINPNVPAGSGLNTSINYVRNSVKATVDAYNGTIHFYVVDPSDPIIRTYQKAFPDLFDSVNDMPSGLRDHWRYPEDIFDTQTQQYTQYHMTNPQQFFQKAALWDVAPSPDAVGTSSGSSVTAAPVGGDNGGRNSTLSGSGNPINPLYLMMQLPGETGQEFVLERPFVPIRKANQLSAFMVARMDGDNYGKLILYQAPDQSNAVSPARASSLIEADPNISAKFSLLDQLGSRVVRGDAQLIPMDGSIFYVRPIYVEGSGNSPLPRFNYVAVTYGERAVLDTNVTSAVGHLLNNTIPPVEITGNTSPVSGPNGNTIPTTTTTPGSTPSTTPITTPQNATVAQLLSEANDLFDQANAALANQDLATFDKDYKQAVALVAEANRLSSGTTSTSGPVSSSTIAPSSTTRPKSGATATTVAHA